MYILLVNFPNGGHYELVNFTGGRERKRSNIPETVIAWRNIVEFADIVEVILHSLALAGHHIRPFECRRAVIDCRLQFNKLLVIDRLRKHNVRQFFLLTLILNSRKVIEFTVFCRYFIGD